MHTLAERKRTQHRRMKKKKKGRRRKQNEIKMRNKTISFPLQQNPKSKKVEKKRETKATC